MTTAALIVVTGASGTGKTTLVRALERANLTGVACYYFDTIGVPSPEEMEARFGGGASWQLWALDQWIARIAGNTDGVAVAVLDARVAPKAVLDAARRHGLPNANVLLIDCDYDERNARLRGPRGQPELANARMDTWAAYLRGQIDALELPRLDTTGATLDDSVGALRTCRTAHETARSLGGRIGPAIDARIGIYRALIAAD
jgi:hypothetical protein